VNATANPTQPRVTVELTPYVLRARGTRRQVINATARRLRDAGERMTPERWTLIERSYGECVEVYYHHPDAPPERLLRYLENVTADREPALLTLLTEMRAWLEAHNA